MNTNRFIGCSTPFEFLKQKYFAEYKAAGITAMELSVDAEYYELINIKSIAKEAVSEGVNTWSFHLPYYRLKGAEITKTNEEERQFAVNFHSEWIKKTADAGFKYAVIHPSGEPIYPKERGEQLKASRACIAELSLIAKENGMRLAVEVLPRTCLGNCSAELLDLLKDAPDAGVCFDTNHLLIEKTSNFIDAVSDKILTLHMSDYDGIDERHWLPGEGIIDWNDFMNRLDSINYTGVLMYEVNRNITSTIHREHPLTVAEIAQNAKELINRQPLTKRGIPLL